MSDIPSIVITISQGLKYFIQPNIYNRLYETYPTPSPPNIPRLMKIPISEFGSRR